MDLATVQERVVVRPPLATFKQIGSLEKRTAWEDAGAPNDMLDDIFYGIWVPSTAYIPPNSCPNYSSIHDNLEAVLFELADLEQDGKIETVPTDEISNTLFSPLGAVPKKGSTRMRVIHDLSLFVNDFLITRKVTCPSLDDILPFIHRDSFLWKRDQKGGYQQYFVETSCRRYYGFQHPDGRLMRFCVLTFGASHSVADFCQFSYFTRDILRSEGIINWTYIDDNFGVADDLLTATQDFVRAGELNTTLFVEESPHKACPPSQVMEVLGYEVNTSLMEVRVPPDKLDKLLLLCDEFLTCKCAKLRDVQSFVGKLTWAARAVKGGRIYLSRLYQLLFVDGPPSLSVRLTSEFRADVRWWKTFLRRWNGVSLIERTDSVTGCSDAAKFGYGGWIGDSVWWGYWDPKCILQHSNWKELNGINLLLKHSAASLQGKKLDLFSDNMASVAICNRGYSRSPKLAKIMRNIFWTVALHDIDLHVHYIPGAANVVADFFSRLQDPSTSKRSLPAEIAALANLGVPVPSEHTVMEWLSSTSMPPFSVSL